MTFTHEITAKEEGIRLDKMMAALDENHSRQEIQRWIKNKHVTVNGQVQKANYRCKEGDIMEWNVPIEEPAEIKPQAIPLDILYEDEYLLVIDKPKGMLVHPTKSIRDNTLVNALKYHCERLSNLSGEERPGVVHRLDKDTSGVLVAAKDNATHEHLKNQFKAKTVTRIYEAIVFGVLSHTKGVIEAPIGRNPKNRLQMAIVENGREAETHFRVLKHFREFTHVECELKTGRTHQIRVHLKYIHHPIVGDELYCRKQTKLMKGQALFSKELSFTHPNTKERMTFTIEQPQSFKNLLKRLEDMS